MPQIFHPSANTIAKVSIFGAVFFIAGALWLIIEINRSSYVTRASVTREQPVPFSHKHHVSGLGIDCRHCHWPAEQSNFAGIPPTKTCMTCHSQIWSDSGMLEPVRESYRTDKSIEWVRVHDLPDFAYFNHSIHINKGVGCVTCHGPVDQMALMRQENTLQMEWCWNCHKHPGPNLRPREEVFNPNWQPAEGEDRVALAAKLMKDYNVRSALSCSTCHR
jgi:hypothetical protein